MEVHLHTRKLSNSGIFPFSLIAADGLGIRTYGIVENVRTDTSRVQIAESQLTYLMDAVDNQDFILRQNFLEEV